MKKISLNDPPMSSNGHLRTWQKQCSSNANLLGQFREWNDLKEAQSRRMELSVCLGLLALSAVAAVILKVMGY